MRDSRLVGSTSENIFLSILNERSVFATSLDTVAFDDVVYDVEDHYFKVGLLGEPARPPVLLCVPPMLQKEYSFLQVSSM